MIERKSEPSVAPEETEDAMETARRIMGRMVRMPPEPHEPLGKPRRQKDSDDGSGGGKRDGD